MEYIYKQFGTVVNKLIYNHGRLKLLQIYGE